MLIASLVHALPPTARRGFNNKEAASYLGVSTGTFTKLVRAGEMPAPVELRGRKIWDRMVLDRFLDQLSSIDAYDEKARGNGDELDQELEAFTAKHGY